jgi:hypothetical protein
VTWNGTGIPLLWMLLPTAGNSHTSERTELLDRLRAAFPDLKIAALMGDREFIGDAWMAYSLALELKKLKRLHELASNAEYIAELRWFAALAPQGDGNRMIAPGNHRSSPCRSPTPSRP